MTAVPYEHTSQQVSEPAVAATEVTTPEAAPTEAPVAPVAEETKVEEVQPVPAADPVKLEEAKQEVSQEIKEEKEEVLQKLEEAKGDAGLEETLITSLLNDKERDKYTILELTQEVAILKEKLKESNDKLYLDEYDNTKLDVPEPLRKTVLVAHQFDANQTDPALKAKLITELTKSLESLTGADYSAVANAESDANKRAVT